MTYKQKIYTTLPGHPQLFEVNNIDRSIFWCLVLTLIVIWAKNPICRQIIVWKIWKFLLLFILTQFFSNNRFKSAKVQLALDDPVKEGNQFQKSWNIVSMILSRKVWNCEKYFLGMLHIYRIVNFWSSQK